MTEIPKLLDLEDLLDNDHSGTESARLCNILLRADGRVRRAMDAGQNPETHHCLDLQRKALEHARLVISNFRSTTPSVF